MLHPRTRLAFGGNGLVEGVIGNGLTYFLLFYYSQVLGLSASLAGLALGIALFFDAVSDPLVGRWSDRLHSKLGRRHPFLYTSIVPLSLCYLLLWIPPTQSLSELGLFTYLLVASVALRLSRTLFSVPMWALVPEVTSDYDERTTLANISTASGWFFGTAMMIAMFAYWLADTADYSGNMRPAGYVEAGAFGAVLILLGAVAASVGTHREIPRLRQPPEARTNGIRNMLAELWQTVADRSVLALFASSIIATTATGVSAVLWIYIQAYYWEFDSAQMSWLGASYLLSAPLAFIVTPRLARWRSKRGAQILVSLVSTIVWVGPILLRSLGAFPGNDHPVLFPLMLTKAIFEGTLTVISYALWYSMVADLAEAREVETGRREEGILYSMQSFVGKASSALGAWVGGIVLDFVAFPRQAEVADVPWQTVFELGLVYGPLLMVFYLISAAALLFYRIDRETHRKNLAALEAS